MDKVKNFLKKYWKSILCYSTIVGLVIFLLISTIISSCNTKDNKTRATILTSQEFLDKIDNKEDFEMVLGAYKCASCKKFNSTISYYIDQGNTLYYLYIDNSNDIKINDSVAYIIKQLSKLRPDRGIYNLQTPTTLIFRNGELKDGYLGFVDYKNKEDYSLFKDVLKGLYINKDLPIKK